MTKLNARTSNNNGTSAIGKLIPGINGVKIVDDIAVDDLIEVFIVFPSVVYNTK